LDLGCEVIRVGEHSLTNFVCFDDRLKFCQMEGGGGEEVRLLLEKDVGVGAGFLTRGGNAVVGEEELVQIFPRAESMTRSEQARVFVGNTIFRISIHQRLWVAAFGRLVMI